VNGARIPPPPSVWMDDRVTVGPSRINGSGLFAVAEIPLGEIVFRLGGRLVSSDDLAALIEEATDQGWYVDTITVYRDEHLVVPPGTAIHYGNHSCDPSLWHVGPYEVATRQHLSPGDELTTDYGTTSGAAGFEMACHCGSDLCRGRVTSEDWRLSSSSTPTGWGRPASGRWSKAGQLGRGVVGELP
jgi:uncharacterized protein